MRHSETRGSHTIAFCNPRHLYNISLNRLKLQLFSDAV